MARRRADRWRWRYDGLGVKTPLPHLGAFSHENTIAVPGFGSKVVTFGFDDSSGQSELYLYLAADQDAYLRGAGKLYVFKTDEKAPSGKNLHSGNLTEGQRVRGYFVEIADPADLGAADHAVRTAAGQGRRARGVPLRQAGGRRLRQVSVQPPGDLFRGYRDALDHRPDPGQRGLWRSLRPGRLALSDGSQPCRSDDRRHPGAPPAVERGRYRLGLTRQHRDDAQEHHDYGGPRLYRLRREPSTWDLECAASGAGKASGHSRRWSS
jgi:hypothetical protein